MSTRSVCLGMHGCHVIACGKQAENHKMGFMLSFALITIIGEVLTLYPMHLSKYKSKIQINRGMKNIEIAEC